MGLFNNKSEGNYVKSYSIPSSCKEEKAHFDTSDRMQGKNETKPLSEQKPKTKVEQKTEAKPAPKVFVKPEPKPKPTVKPKTEQESKPKTDFSQRQRTRQTVPPSGHTPGGTPNNPQGKGCLNHGKVGCAVIIFIFFGIKKCTDSLVSSFSYDSNDDVEVVYDTALYDYDDAEEYIMQDEAIDSIEYDTIFE